MTLIYDDKYLKATIKSSKDEIKTFYVDGLSRENSSCIVHTTIFSGSIFESGENYYPEEFIKN